MTPKTLAGKALREAMGNPAVTWNGQRLNDAILAIESEARAEERERWVKALSKYGHHLGDCPQKHGYACVCGFARALLADPPR